MILLLSAAEAVAQLDPRIAPQELERRGGEGLPFGGRSRWMLCRRRERC